MARTRKPIQLTNAHYDILQEGFNHIGRVRDMLPQCQACGIDVREYESVAATTEEKLKQIEKEFFPKGRPK